MILVVRDIGSNNFINIDANRSWTIEQVKASITHHLKLNGELLPGNAFVLVRHGIILRRDLTLSECGLLQGAPYCVLARKPCRPQSAPRARDRNLHGPSKRGFRSCVLPDMSRTNNLFSTALRSGSRPPQVAAQEAKTVLLQHMLASQKASMDVATILSAGGRRHSVMRARRRSQFAPPRVLERVNDRKDSIINTIRFKKGHVSPGAQISADKRLASPKRQSPISTTRCRRDAQ